MTAQEELDQSRLFCQELTRREAKNFYYGLRLLPPAKRAAMFALYAYMRQVDDIVDAEDGPAPQGREEQLESWRRQTHAVLAGDATPDGHAVWPAFADMVRHYSIPERVFDEVIAGQRQDLRPIEFEEFDHLYEYCYRVAGVVGLACIYIWGFEGGARTEQLAVDRGIAFQLTNILRDLREDAGRGRVYLPRSELTKLQLSDQDLLGDGDASGEPFLQMMRQQIERAELYYQKSAGLEERVSRDSRPTLVAMTAIYRGLLRKVSRRPERVLDGRVSLSVPSKLLIGWRALRAR
jgi:15-cis-phytoene synthase